VSIDVTRLSSLRNELQSSADAGAHAGAIQLIEPNDPMHSADTATAYASRYLAMQGAVAVDSVELGRWDDDGDVFNPGLTPFNAVRIVVSRQAPGLLVSHFGVSAPRVRARAVTWVERQRRRAALPGSADAISGHFRASHARYENRFEATHGGWRPAMREVADTFLSLVCSSPVTQ
jgi:hypothetical protein